jgi:hypothetical protein
MILPPSRSSSKHFFYLYLGLLFIQCTPSDSNPPDSPIYELSIETKGGGRVSIPSSRFAPNSFVTIRAIPSEGYYFDHWEGFDQKIEINEYMFIITQNLVINAVFLPLPELQKEVEIYTPKKMDVHPVFMIENGGSQAYLTDKTGVKLQTWNFDSKLGNEIKRLEDGSLIGLFKPDRVSFSFGGYGGVLKKFSPSGDLIWEFEMNTDHFLLHHDFEIKPNGNILLLVWERFNQDQALQLGFQGTGSIYLEKLIEWNPLTREVEWEWRSVDHLIQDLDDSVSTYGVIADHPEKIDLNYSDSDNGDLMHANGLFYDSKRDLIFLSVNFYSEVWVIDHSLTTEKSATELGDLRYRFGNPDAYQGLGTRLFYNNHHPTLVQWDPMTEGRLLLFMNGSEEEQSKVMEFILPSIFDQDPIEWMTPEPSWSFSHTDLFFGKISGAYRLPNGNTLICEGDYGYWEVTRGGEVVWKYNGDTNFWRGYVYP